jgi:hypothetical protein
MVMRALALAVIAACGYPPLDNGTDGNTGGDGSSGCQAAASYGPETPSDQSGDFFPGNSTQPDEVDYAGQLNATDVLSIGLLDDQPPFTSGFTTGTFNLSGQTDFMTCGTCVLIAAHCNNCDLSTGTGVGSWYMATGGSLNLTTFTQTSLSGTLTNASLMHVTINFSNGATSPASDGCSTHIASATFSVALTQH